jgi:integrase
VRLPNGFGAVVKLGGNRRRPYAARVTTGWSAEGRQLQRYLGYFTTRTEALTALAEFNAHPHDLDNRRMTFAELYERWGRAKHPDGVPPRYTTAYANAKGLHGMAFVDIRRRHIQGAVDALTELGYGSRKNVKTLCSQLFKYAVDLELVTTNLASGVELPAQAESDVHRPFTDDELAELWRRADDHAVRIALVLSYTGLRPTELLRIRTADVHLDQRVMYGGMKTAAGRNRCVPIADKVYPFIREWYGDGSAPVLVSEPADYQRLRRLWLKCPLLQGHLPHDGRHTCATRLDNAGVDLKTQQLILGHRSASITRRVYTHKTVQQLLDAVNRL